MPVFKTTVRIQASGELAIRDLPFAPGTLVEVLVMGSERSPAEREQEWARMMQAQTISAEDIATEIDRRAAMRQALTAVAQAGTFATVDDVSAWQRELRVDRAQPGRED